MKFNVRFWILQLAICAISVTAVAQGQPAVKNIIFMIGDGMGLAQVSATLIDRDYAPMAMERAQYIGLCKTYSASDKVTDSAAAGTALSCGVKTYNGAIGMDMTRKPVPSILEKAHANGFATGIVVTCYVTHATPAAFMAHRPSRLDYYDIAKDIVKSGVDVFIGGGMDHFVGRPDSLDLIRELKAKGYTVARTMDEVSSFGGRKLAGLLAPQDMPSMLQGRGDYLPQATGKALELLAKSPKGFFIMIEGSQIDYMGHANNVEGVIAETIDFDKAVKAAFDFADRNPGTLVVVTADHETGGLTIPTKGDGTSAEYKFSTLGHTASLVPIYAYGAGAENFTGFHENADMPKIMERLMGIKR